MLPCSPEEFGEKRFLLKSIAYNATARADMFTLPCSDEVRSPEARMIPHHSIQETYWCKLSCL